MQPLALLALCLSANAGVPLVPLATDEGLARLARSSARVDFPRLANEFESQENKAFCGVASAVIVLNALRDRVERFEKPEDPRLVPEGWGAPTGFDPLFHRYTQGNFFTPETDALKRRDEVLGQPRSPGGKRNAGLQLRELGKLLEAHGVTVEAHVADDSLQAAAVRRDFLANLSREGDYLVVNYNRAALGQSGGGHISPIAAYDAPSDSVLILDVNPNAQPWVWVPTAKLLEAMRTRDTVENRGYLSVREGPKPN